MYISTARVCPMFYAPEILSLQSKTGLSMLYYMATARGPRRLSRQRILRTDILAMIDEIENPAIPFSLRLYSYLLSGLARVWATKLECCLRGARCVVVPQPKPRPRALCARAREHPNLQLDDEYIDDVEDLCDATGPDDAAIMDHADLISMGSQEDPRHGSGCMPESSLCLAGLLPDTAARKRRVIDARCTLGPAEIFVRRTAEGVALVLPDRIGCYIVDNLCKMIAVPKMGACLDIDDDMEIGSFGDAGSVEDPRLSNSTLSCERSEQTGAPYSECATRAAWFYGILLRAARGEIIVEQRAPFGEILVIQE